MLHLTFYKTADDPRRINKNLSTVGTATAAPTTAVNMLNPLLTLNYNAALLSANYVYISEFSRYYYIENMEIDTAQRLNISCKVDVLMSHANNILACEVIAKRSEVKYNLYLQDPNAPTEQKTQVQIKKLSGGNPQFGAGSFIMVAF